MDAIRLVEVAPMDMLSLSILVVPLVGAFFIDTLNAGTINFFIRLIRDWLL